MTTRTNNQTSGEKHEGINFTQIPNITKNTNEFLVAKSNNLFDGNNYANMQTESCFKIRNSYNIDYKNNSDDKTIAEMLKTKMNTTNSNKIINFLFSV